MSTFKDFYYDYYREKGKRKFDNDYHPLKYVRHVLTIRKQLKYLDKLADRCIKNIPGFISEIDYEGCFHFFAPMKYFDAEYWQKINSTQITFHEDLVKELELQESTYVYENRLWRTSYHLSLFDNWIELFINVQKWFETDKPEDDKAYETIDKYMVRFTNYLDYCVFFDKPTGCTFFSRYNETYSDTNSVHIDVHYDNIINDVKAGIRLLLMREMMLNKKEIMELEDKQNTIMEMIKKI